MFRGLYPNTPHVTALQITNYHLLAAVSHWKKSVCTNDGVSQDAHYSSTDQPLDKQSTLQVQIRAWAKDQHSSFCFDSKIPMNASTSSKYPLRHQRPVSVAVLLCTHWNNTSMPGRRSRTKLTHYQYHSMNLEPPYYAPGKKSIGTCRHSRG